MHSPSWLNIWSGDPRRLRSVEKREGRGCGRRNAATTLNWQKLRFGRDRDLPKIATSAVRVPLGHFYAHVPKNHNRAPARLRFLQDPPFSGAWLSAVHVSPAQYFLYATISRPFSSPAIKNNQEVCKRKRLTARLSSSRMMPTSWQGSAILGFARRGALFHLEALSVSRNVPGYAAPLSI